MRVSAAATHHTNRRSPCDRFVARGTIHRIDAHIGFAAVVTDTPSFPCIAGARTSILNTTFSDALAIGRAGGTASVLLGDAGSKVGRASSGLAAGSAGTAA